MIFIKNHITFFCYGISFFVYTAILIWGIIGDHRGSYFGYGLFSFYFAIPTLSLIMALVLNLNNASLKWLYPLLFGVFGIAISALVSWVKLSSWALFLDTWLFCIIPAFVGSGIGYIIRISRHS